MIRVISSIPGITRNRYLYKLSLEQSRFGKMGLLSFRGHVTRIFRIELPAGIPLLNVNDRSHWSKRARITSDIRLTARNLASHVPHLDKIKIRAVYYAPNNRRRDMSNLFLNIKAAVDGIVDAGVIKDDSDKY